MVLKLYGFSPSTNTQRVVLVLNELNVPFEYVTVDLSKGEHKGEEYMKIQPFGCVPCIVHIWTPSRVKPATKPLFRMMMASFSMKVELSATTS